MYEFEITQHAEKSTMPSFVASQFARHFAIKIEIANAWITKHQGYFYDSLCAAQNDPEAFQKFVTSFSESCDTKTDYNY